MSGFKGCMGLVRCTARWRRRAKWSIAFFDSSPYSNVWIREGGGNCKTARISVTDCNSMSSVDIFRKGTFFGKNCTVSASRIPPVDGR